MAVDALRRHGRIIDIGAVEIPRAGSLLPLAGGLGEISNPLFVAGRHWELSTAVTPCGRNEPWFLRCNRRGQPALHSADDAHDSSGHCLDRSDPFASCRPSTRVALWILGRHFPMVLPMASDCPSHPKSGALPRTTRSASAARASACGGHRERDREDVLA